MYSQYQKVGKAPLIARLRFLFTGYAWLRIDHNEIGLPSSFAVGFKQPEETQEATQEELDELQQQIEANRAAAGGMPPVDLQISKEEFEEGMRQAAEMQHEPGYLDRPQEKIGRGNLKPHPGKLKGRAKRRQAKRR